MLRRLSANLLLQSVILVIGAALMVVLAVGAWDAWRAVGTASRLERMAEVGRHAFRAMHNLRLDRSLATRALRLEGSPEPGQLKQIVQAREAELPALAATIAALRLTDIAGRDTLLAQLEKGTTRLTELAKESAADFNKPKSARRAGLPKEFESLGNELIALLDKISGAVVAAAKYNDAFVDQMMLMRDAVWIVRATGGDMAVMISNSIGFKKKLTEADLQKFAGYVARSDAGWEMFEKMRDGAVLPPALIAAIEKVKTAYLGTEFTTRREKLVAALAGAEALQLTTSDWTSDSVPRLATLTDLAEAALAAAQQHAAGQLAAAQGSLALKLALLIGGITFGTAGYFLIARRVIRPLSDIQTAMMKVANGDLGVEVPFADRSDEIGALAQALSAFKRNAGEKARIEREQQSRSEQAAVRQKAIEAHIAAFESHVGEALQALASASGDMRKTSDKLAGSAESTNRQAKDAAGASANASDNVQTVAAASQELSASIGEIGRQVAHAASIAGRAVAETQATDSTVQGLTEAAQRIGQITGLINEIADQTNLLALNATIEAARAGEAGKGFAVVAAEVKSLANQTAKATGDISSQIGAIQEVAEKAVQAMRRIGGTIGEVNSVAASIASAVEEQGAATQEITRNTQEAARRTGEVADNITGVTAGADATGLAAADVRTSAEALSRQADKLRTEVDDFLAKIRAA
ncbi:MAG TPA: HAMP domain-containing methyl-accepting chemotaxis protein [Xanthobacteraceae bacterium]|nr:HAMP domain-containing methyl-accepting chemotaxis protein [Xanthobacteraceae bacterium]